MSARWFHAWSLCCAALLLGCGGGGEIEKEVGDPMAPSRTGSVAITLVNEGTSPTVKAVSLEVTGVEARTAHGPWIPVPMADLSKQVELMQAQPVPLIEDGALAEGTYQEVKFRLGDRHSFTDGDGHRHDLSAPADLVCTHLDLKARPEYPTRYAFLVSAASAVREVPGHAGVFALQAHALIARPMARTGFITGKVAVEATNRPVAGTILTAQSTPPGGMGFEFSPP